MNFEIREQGDLTCFGFTDNDYNWYVILSMPRSSTWQSQNGEDTVLCNEIFKQLQELIDKETKVEIRKELVPVNVPVEVFNRQMMNTLENLTEFLKGLKK